MLIPVTADGRLREASGLQIRLDTEIADSSYCPGDVISGTLTLRHHDHSSIGKTAGIDVSKLTLLGYAESKATLGNGSNGRQDGRALLLHITQRLRDMPHADHVDGKGCEWRFSITVPRGEIVDEIPPGLHHWYSRHNRGDYWHDYSPDDRFNMSNSEIRLSLPPSFSHHAYRRFDTQIKYQLTAQVYLSPELRRDMPIRVDRTINIAPLSPAILPPPCQANMHLKISPRPHLLHENMESQPPVRERVSGLFHHQSVPDIQFRCTTSLPGYIRAEEPMSFTFQLTLDEPRSTALIPAKVTLQRCNVKIMALTLVRVPGTLWTRGSYIHKQSKDQVSRQATQVAVEAKTPLINKENAYKITASLPGSAVRLAPSFTTYNVSRSYLMRVCGSKDQNRE